MLQPFWLLVFKVDQVIANGGKNSNVFWISFLFYNFMLMSLDANVIEGFRLCVPQKFE
jgi:hypothetical protein